MLLLMEIPLRWRKKVCGLMVTIPAKLNILGEDRYGKRSLSWSIDMQVENFTASVSALIDIPNN